MYQKDWKRLEKIQFHGKAGKEDGFGVALVVHSAHTVLTKVIALIMIDGSPNTLILKGNMILL